MSSSNSSARFVARSKSLKSVGVMRHRFLMGAVVSAALAVLCGAAPNASAVLVTYFNFNDSNLVSDAPGIQASTITTSGFNPTFIPGSTLNIAPGDPVTGTVGNSALRLTYANNQDNPRTFQFTINTLGLTDLSLSYATRSSIVGITQTLSYSTDGVNFTNFTPTFSPTATFSVASFDLSAINSIENQASVTFRISITPRGGNNNEFNDFDNIQVNAEVPEPGTVVGGLLSVLAIGWHQRRRLAKARHRLGPLRQAAA